MAVSDWSTSASSNTSVGGKNIGEGMLRADVNDALRAIMAEAKAGFVETGTAFWVTPEMYGAAGNGTTNDDTALASAIAALSSTHPILHLSKTYLISQALVFTSLSNFAITGGGTIKIADGTATALGNAAFRFVTCTDFVVENITVDGNRANRTPAEASGHLVRIEGGARGHFRNVYVKNGTTDGWYVVATDSATQSTYPTDMVFEDCVADNNYRNGMSIIGAVRPKVVRGRYINTTGTAPQSGIDVEPNTADVYGVTDALFEHVEISSNVGYGMQLTGATGSGGTIRPRVVSCWGTGNTGGFIQIDRATDTMIDRPKVLDHSTFAPTGVKGLIEATVNASRLAITSPRFAGITATSANACCIHSSVTDATITDFRAENIACGALNLPGTGQQVNGATVINSTFTGVSILVSGTRSRIRNVTIRGHSGTYGLQCSASRLVLSDVYCEDCAGTYSVYLDSSTTNIQATGITVHQTVAVPGSAYAIRLDNAPDTLENVHATGGYTTTNIFFATAAAFSGSKVSCISPDPFKGSATIDPASLAAQATTTGTKAMTYANTNDRVFVQPQIDLAGLILTAYVSATGTVTYRLTNPTAGAIDLASATWDFYLVKQ